MRRGDRGLGARLGWTVLAAALLLASPAVADEPTPPTEKPKLTWGWWWDEKLHYHLEVPLEKIWLLPDTGPITGKPLEERLAFVGTIGGRVQVDTAGYHQTQGLEDVHGGIALRRLRFGTRGDFYLLQRVSYAADLELQERTLQMGDVYLWWRQVPVVGRFKIGNFDPSVTLESVTGSRDTLFMESGLPVLAFAPGRSSGIEVGGPILGERVTWALGASRTIQTPVVGDQSKAGGRVSGRLTWLVEDTRTAPRLTHLGASTSVLLAPADVQYRARPESFLAPTLVDTGGLRADDATVVGAEFLRIDGPWLVMSEAIMAAVGGGRQRGILWGAYASIGRFLTGGDSQPYDRGDGSLGRFEPSRPFSWSARTWGALRAAARVSYLDLDDAPIKGGRETNVVTDLSWYLGHYVVLKLELGYAAIRSRPNDGNLYFIQSRFQYDFY